MATICVSLDAAGEPRQIQPGAPFVTHWVIVADAQEAAWSGVAIGQRAPFEVSHPWNALDVFSDADLARYCIERVAVADPPSGEQLVSVSLASADGVITATPTFGPGPRAELDKGVIEERLNAIGKLRDAFAALQANPVAFGQWFRQSWPNVYKDDPALLEMLQGIGLTTEQIATVTA